MSGTLLHVLRASVLLYIGFAGLGLLEKRCDDV